MRLHEILNERLTTSSYGSQTREIFRTKLPKVINDWYMTNAKNLPFYVYKDDQDAMNIDKTPGIQKVTNLLNAVICSMFQQQANKIVDTTKKSQPIVVVFTTFQKQTTNGEYSGQTNAIRLNAVVLKKLVQVVYENLMDSFLNSGFEVHQNSFQPDHNFDSIIDELCDVFTHEMVHAEQWNRADPAKTKGRQYRSYVMKNKDKFYAELNKEISDDQAYLGSPEEIDAFAHEFVYHTMRDTLQDDPEYQVQLLDDLLSTFNDTVSHTRYNNMKGSDNPDIEKSRRRFLKKVYQELDDRRDKARQAFDQHKEQEADKEWARQIDWEDDYRQAA